MVDDGPRNVDVWSCCTVMQRGADLRQANCETNLNLAVSEKPLINRAGQLEAHQMLS